VADIECRPCEFVECPIGHVCAAMVEPEQVVKEAMSVMERRRDESTHDATMPSVWEESRA
ncbi:MAG TPA: hypothetical protein VKB78_06610, partial [Pirellulales bacterium]|nr:hypothetical protein [Pirellulales bacterium]